MPFTFPWENPLLCLFPDKCISFNIKRPAKTILQPHRNVIALAPGRVQGTIVPGISTKRDKELIRHLKKIQNWRKVKDYSFGVNREFYSMLWKFRLSSGRDHLKLTAVEPLQSRQAKLVKNAVRNHAESLKGKLRPGNVFLIPDREITFYIPHRSTKPYARPVLIYSIRPGQVLLIPFSTKISWADPETDIIFDKSHRGPALEETARPAVENYPYRMFSKTNVLYVRAIQPITIDDFLAGALIHVGAVRRELLSFLGRRLKNIYPNP